jgi:hypothetical protein
MSRYIHWTLSRDGTEFVEFIAKEGGHAFYSKEEGERNNEWRLVKDESWTCNINGIIAPAPINIESTSKYTIYESREEFFKAWPDKTDI